MLGPVILVVVLLVGIPVSVIMSGAVLAGLFGWTLKEEAHERHEGSELLPLS